MTDDATLNGSAVIESLRRDCDLPAAVPDEVIQTAIHEAGHAVTAWALGMPVRTLFILLDGTGGQCMSGDTGHSYFDPARLRSEMVFVAAGTEAQSLLGASSGQCFSEQDEHRLVRCAQELHGLFNPRGMLEQICDSRQQARAIVINQWSRIMRAARVALVSYRDFKTLFSETDSATSDNQSHPSSDVAAIA